MRETIQLRPITVSGLQELPQRPNLSRRQCDSAPHMLIKRRERHRRNRPRKLKDSLRVSPSFSLRVPRESQTEELKEVIQVHLPVKLSEHTSWQHVTSLLPSHTNTKHVRISTLRTFLSNIPNRVRFHRQAVIKRRSRRLLIQVRLSAELTHLMKIRRQLRITRADLIHARHAVPQPLPSHEQRRFNVKRKHDLL